ncbi:MAG: hypothetical protein ACWA5W_00905, partial [Phycisphaerales bacterium]
ARQDEQWAPDMDNEGLDQLADLMESLEDQEYGQAEDHLDELLDQLDQMSDQEREEVRRALEDLAEKIEPDAKDLDQSSSDQTIPDEPSSEDDLSDRLSEALKEQAENISKGNPNELPESNQKPEQRPDPDSAQDQGEDQGQDQTQEDQGQPGNNGKSAQDQNQSQTQGQGQQEKESNSKSDAQPSDQPTGQEDGQSGKKAGDQSGDQTGGQNEDSEDQQPIRQAIKELQDRQQQRRQQRRQAQDIRNRAQEMISPEDDGERDPSGDDDRPQGRSMNPSGEERDDSGGSPFEQLSDEGPASTPTPTDGIKPEFDLMDAGSTPEQLNPTDEPVGKWYAPEGDQTDSSGARRSAAQRFRQASKQAKRAIEEQQVPRKYQRVVREAFDRVNKRAQSLESDKGAGSKIAPQGQDAVSKKATKAHSKPKPAKGDDG